MTPVVRCEEMKDWKDIPAVRDALDLIDETIGLLREGTSGGSSEYLQRHLSTIRDGTPWSRKEVFKKIQTMCNPKDLGDMFDHGMTWEEWWAHVEKLDAACGCAFAALEEQFSTLSQEERLKHEKYRTTTSTGISQFACGL